MEHLVKYRTWGNATPPRQTQMKIPGGAGELVTMKNGAKPQPWHCKPFVDGSTYGLELIYPFETECHIVHDDKGVRVDWDFSREKAEGISGGEFVLFAPDHYL